MKSPRTLRTVTDLITHNLVEQRQQAGLEEVSQRYPVAITSHLASLLTIANNQALARQFIPDRAELKSDVLERADPIADHRFSPLPGLVHRYPDRVLIKLVHVCPVYCRFCFRREMVGPDGDGTLSDSAFAAILTYVKAHPAIWEVILTGGDPLMLSARRIGEVTKALAALPHVKVLRWHTRMPIADPERITPAIVRALKSPGIATCIGVHANHASELTASARASLARLAEAGIALVSQSVLLKGVNDNVETLEALMRAFVESGVKPYYLHHPDLAPGTGHFRLSIARGQRLMSELRRRLSGLAMPSYVIDVPDGAGKIPVGPSYIKAAGGSFLLTTLGGKKRAYPPRRNTSRTST